MNYTVPQSSIELYKRNTKERPLKICKLIRKSPFLKFQPKIHIVIQLQKKYLSTIHLKLLVSAKHF